MRSFKIDNKFIPEQRSSPGHPEKSSHVFVLDTRSLSTQNVGGNVQVGEEIEIRIHAIGAIEVSAIFIFVDEEHADIRILENIPTQTRNSEVGGRGLAKLIALHGNDAHTIFACPSS